MFSKTNLAVSIVIFLAIIFNPTSETEQQKQISKDFDVDQKYTDSKYSSDQPTNVPSNEKQSTKDSSSVKKEEKKLQGHLEPIGKSGDINSIDTSDGYLSPQNFLNDYVLQNRPLLMKGAGKVSPAFSLWNDAYLKSQIPNGPEANISAEFGKKESRQKDTKSINFKEFLDTYNSSDIYMVNGVPQYLKKDIVVPWSIQCEDYKRGLKDFVVWLSSGGTKSVLHHDSYENINCLYRGSKRLVMINTTRYIDSESQIIDVQDGAYSSMDVERVDLEKFPIMSGIQFHEAVMEAGDCLYIPFRWIHHVDSVGSNLAVNIWWDKLINKRIDLAKCALKFDESLNLEKLNVTIEGENESPEEDTYAYSDTIDNIKFLIFSSGSEAVKTTDFMKALLDEFAHEPELKSVVLNILELVQGERPRNLVKEEDIDSIPEDEMEQFYNYAQEYDRISKVIGKDIQLTKGLLPGARDYFGYQADANPDEDSTEKENNESSPPVDEKVYQDLDSTVHTEL